MVAHCAFAIYFVVAHKVIFKYRAIVYCEWFVLSFFVTFLLLLVAAWYAVCCGLRYVPKIRNSRRTYRSQVVQLNTQRSVYVFLSKHWISTRFFVVQPLLFLFAAHIALGSFQLLVCLFVVVSAFFLSGTIFPTVVYRNYFIDFQIGKYIWKWFV